MLLHHPLHSHWGKMTHCWTYSPMSWCSQLGKSFRYMASITWLPFHNSPFSFIIFIFVLLSCFQWFFRLSRMDGIIWKLTEKPLFEVSPRGNLSRLRAAKSPSNRYLLYKHFSITRFMSSVHILTCSRHSSFIRQPIQLL